MTALECALQIMMSDRKYRPSKSTLCATRAAVNHSQSYADQQSLIARQESLRSFTRKYCWEGAEGLQKTVSDTE